MPCPGRIIGLGLDREGVESVLAAAVDLFRVELSCRGVKLHDGRMGVRDGVLPVLKDQGDMQGVSRPPDTAFPIDEGLETLFQCLSSDIETAKGILVTFRHLKVACRFAPLGDNHEWLSRE